MRIPWTFYDAELLTTWELPINPDKMTSPFPRKSLRHVRGSRVNQNEARSWMDPKTAHQWQFEGVIRTQEFHDDLLAWAEKPYLIDVTDHFARTWRVIIQRFEPQDRQPTLNTPWRMRYRMHTLSLGQVVTP